MEIVSRGESDLDGMCTHDQYCDGWPMRNARGVEF